MHLIIAHYVDLESINILDLVNALAIIFHDVVYEGSDVLMFDKLKNFEACGIQKVVSRHRFKKYVQNRFENMALGDLSIVILILQVDAGAKELQGS